MIYFTLTLLIIFLILMINVEIKFVFNYSEDDMRFRVYIFKFDITRFIRTKKKKLNHVDGNLESKALKSKLNFEISITLLIEILNKIKLLKRKPRFKIKNYTEFGFEDADVTAILYGYLFIIHGIILKLISSYVDLNILSVRITPKYNCNFLKFYFEGILKIRMAKIIYISFLFITLGRKLNGSTSNRKFNEKYT